MTSPLEQKIKITGPVVVTANRVGDGAVVYRRGDGGWTTDLHDAAVTANAATARELVTAAIADDLRAVGPYIAPARSSSAAVTWCCHCCKPPWCRRAGSATIRSSPVMAPPRRCPDPCSRSPPISEL